MPDLMSNIYLAPTDYRYWGDVSVSPNDYKNGSIPSGNVKSWDVYLVPVNIRIAGFQSEAEAQAFIVQRCNPITERPKVYSDICRCGRCGPAWDYIRTGDLVFERCKNCKMPMRHDVMLAINKPLTKDFDLDDFLSM